MFCIPALFFVGTHDIENDFRFKITTTKLLAKMYLAMLNGIVFP